MGYTATPLPVLIELSALRAHATFAYDKNDDCILGLVRDAIFYESGSKALRQLIKPGDTHAGLIAIAGQTYNIQLVAPTPDPAVPVVVTFDGGRQTTALCGDGPVAPVAFLIATPTSGGMARYFAFFDRDVPILPDVTAIKIGPLDTAPQDPDTTLEVEAEVTTDCFLEGTVIRTPLGETRVEYLKVGDLVTTVDHGPQPIRWIGRRDVTFTDENHHARPIQIKADGLSPGCPTSDLAVSPDHRILLEGPEVAFHFGAVQVLGPAKGLTELPNIRRMRGKSAARYYALLLDRHGLMWANGLRAESFFPDRASMTALDPQAQAHVAKLLPQITKDAQQGYGPYARPILNCQDTRTLARALSRQVPFHPAAE